MKRVLSNKWSIAVFVLPTVLFFTYIVIIPIFKSLYYSMLNEIAAKVGDESTFVGLGMAKHSSFFSLLRKVIPSQIRIAAYIVIIAGYFDLYILAERAGQKFASSEHVRFLQDQTVFKGTARYDGAPAIAEAFVVIAIKGATVNAAAVTFPTDTAN